jgi:hypothetical protein
MPPLLLLLLLHFPLLLLLGSPVLVLVPGQLLLLLLPRSCSSCSSCIWRQPYLTNCCEAGCTTIASAIYLAFLG